MNSDPFVLPVTLCLRGVRLEPLGFAHEQGLREAAKDIVGDVMSSVGVESGDDKKLEAALDAASGR